MVAGALAALLAGMAAGVLFGPDSGGAHALFWLVVPVQNLGIIGALVWLGRRRGYGNPARELGLRVERPPGTVWGGHGSGGNPARKRSLWVEPRQGWWILAGAGALIALGLLTAGLLDLLGVESRQNAQTILEMMVETRGTVTVAAVVIGVVILGPAAEELLYRGLALQTVLQGGRPPALAATVSAAVFSLVHLADPSLFSAAGAVTLTTLFLLGLFLGAVRIRTGGLGAPIFIHSGFNLTSVLAVLFTDPEWASQGGAAVFGPAGVLLSFFPA